MDWKARLTKQMQALGTYKPAFDASIEILADILTQRDRAKEQWKIDGCVPVVENSNKGQSTHPCLKLAMDCETAALPYLRELGLTASAHKKIKGELKESQSECVLDDLKSRFKVG